MASLVLEYVVLLIPEVFMCLSSSLCLLLALCVASVASFFGLMCVNGGGVLSARLMVSSQGLM